QGGAVVVALDDPDQGQLGVEDELVAGAAAAEVERLADVGGGGGVEVVLDVEGAEQGVGGHRDLAPAVDELGALVHQVEPVGQGGTGDDGDGLVLRGAEQVDAVDAQLRQGRPGPACGLDAFAERLLDDVLEQAGHAQEQGGLE